MIVPGLPWDAGAMATVVAFHAHPDDEVLLTGGTLARAAAEGHRVVIVVACDGVVTAASEASPTRLNELRASAAILGVQRVEHLGYADSGYGPVLYPDPPDRQRFVRANTGEAAERLATILREENADVLLSYDRNGGYGHRDHLKVHEVGKRAAELAGVGTVLEATMPREVVGRLVRLLCVSRIPFRYDADALQATYSPGSAITHRVNVHASHGKSRRPWPRIVPRSTGAAGLLPSCGCSSGFRRRCLAYSLAVNGSSTLPEPRSRSPPAT
jgi:LmbE family N-acetylglucosaminyl deacetylase